MSESRDDYQSKDAAVQRAAGMSILTAEALRGSAQAAPPAKGDERLPLFWRVFGGTLLSIVALVCITIVQQIFASVSELRTNLAHLQEAQSGLVKKDEYSARSTNMWNGIREDTIFVPNTFGPMQKMADELGTPLYEPANVLLDDRYFDNLSGQQAYKCFACRVRKA